MSDGDPLGRYRDMRDFGDTPEPAGERGGDTVPDGDGREADLPRFVIQQHDATRLHWDLRLERDGVLASWAVPRGIPWSPDENHLAVHTEDHPLEYLEFEGDIPEGNYGAGRMTVWDRGVYEPEVFEEGKVRVVLHGERVQGRYALFPVRGTDWMIHRMDPPADPDRRPLPDDLKPMLAVPGPLPDDDEAWGFEIRWSGARVLVAGSGGRIDVRAPAGDGGDMVEVTDRLPELRRLGRAMGATEALLDGVVVALGEGGQPVPDGSAVQRRLDAANERSVRRLARSSPVALMIVDVLWLDGRPVLDAPYEERREALAELGLAGDAWQTPAMRAGGGPDLLEAARARGLPGLVAKRLGSPYRPGEESPDWRAIPA